MSDYRYQIRLHDGLDCLHVMIDGDDRETHLPLGDIQADIIAHWGRRGIVDDRVERTFTFLDTLADGHYLFKTDTGSLVTEQMVKEHLPELFERARRKLRGTENTLIKGTQMRIVIEIVAAGDPPK